MFKCAGSRERASAVEDKKKKGILSFRSSQIMLGLGFVRLSACVCAHFLQKNPVNVIFDYLSLPDLFGAATTTQTPL